MLFLFSFNFVCLKNSVKDCVLFMNQKLVIYSCFYHLSVLFLLLVSNSFMIKPHILYDFSLLNLFSEYASFG